MEEHEVFAEIQALQQQFLDELRTKGKKSKHTVASYRLDLDAFLDFVTKSEKNVREQTVESYVTRYVLFLKQNSSLRAVSVARKISCLSTFLRFLEREGKKIDLSLKRPYFVPKKPQFLPYKSIQELFDLSEKNRQKSQYYLRERALWELLLSTGIRCAEIVNLSVGDVSLSERTLSVKDNKGIRAVMFNERAYYWLSEYLCNERHRYDPKEQFLFLNNAGFRLTHRAIQRSLKLLERMIETKTILTPHVIRHSYAMFLLSQGNSYETVKYILGLKATETVEKYKVS